MPAQPETAVVQAEVDGTDRGATATLEFFDPLDPPADQSNPTCVVATNDYVRFAAESPDAGVDAGVDAGDAEDAGNASEDAGATDDGGTGLDAGVGADAGAGGEDSGPGHDAGAPGDDAGTVGRRFTSGGGGCGCSVVGQPGETGGIALLVLLGALSLGSRGRRRPSRPSWRRTTSPRTLEPRRIPA